VFLPFYLKSVFGVRLAPVVGLMIVILVPLNLTTVKPAHSECPPFPDVAWWNDLSHDNVRKYVGTKHGGDWDAYIEKWQRQLKFVQNVYDRGSIIVVSADKIRLKGEDILTYRENIEKRLDVIRCLARTSQKPQPATPLPQVTKDRSKSNSTAGGLTAKAVGCIKCHGNNGLSENPSVPNLAGQNDLYLIKQIKEFQKPPRKDLAPVGTIDRHSKVMGPRVKNLTDVEIWNLASFYSSRKCGPKKAQSTPPSVPDQAMACIKCHGLMGTSIFPEVPNLAGQNKNYIIRQLSAFRKTANTKNAVGEDQRYHYIMAEQARGLSDFEIVQLADFFTGLNCR